MVVTRPEILLPLLALTLEAIVTRTRSADHERT